MTLNIVKKTGLLFTFLLCVINPAKAALITTDFSELTGNQGTVDISLSLASGEHFSGFSLYFSESLFADLDIVFSPVEWDSIVFQPDALLGAGAFDSYNPLGLSSGLARVSFTYLSTLPFDALAYDFYDEDYQIVASGTATQVSASVPESSSIVLLLLGLIALGFHARARNSNTIALTAFGSIKPQQVAV